MLWLCSKILFYLTLNNVQWGARRLCSDGSIFSLLDKLKRQKCQLWPLSCTFLTFNQEVVGVFSLTTNFFCLFEQILTPKFIKTIQLFAMKKMVQNTFGQAVISIWFDVESKLNNFLTQFFNNGDNHSDLTTEIAFWRNLTAV